MIRFIGKEVDIAPVVHAGGQPQVTHRSFDGDIAALERWLWYTDLTGDHKYTSRELVGIELLPDA